MYCGPLYKQQAQGPGNSALVTHQEACRHCGPSKCCAPRDNAASGTLCRGRCGWEVQCLPSTHKDLGSPRARQKLTSLIQLITALFPTHTQLTAACLASLGKPGLYQPPLCTSQLHLVGGGESRATKGYGVSWILLFHWDGIAKRVLCSWLLS